MKAIQVNNLSKSYGELQAVKDFSFSVEKGEILAVLGPDGAGKTSIFRALCNLIDFDSGRIEIAGYDLSTEFELIKPVLGYMPQTFSLYPDLSVEENLSFYAGLFGLNRKQYNRKKEQLYEFSGLGPFAGRRAAALSGGMKQKLALSCNLIHDPEILLLDEPTTGVDPLSRRQFWDILKTLKETASAIVVATAYMDEVALSDRAIFIYQGIKLAEGTPDELIAKFEGKVYRIDFLPAVERMYELSNIDGLKLRRSGSSLHIYTRSECPIEKFYDLLAEVGIKPEMIKLVKPDLEDTFTQLMGR